jgi:hypothetical protein
MVCATCNKAVKSSNSPPGPCPSPRYWRCGDGLLIVSHILIFRLVQVKSKNAAGCSLVEELEVEEIEVEAQHRL